MESDKMLISQSLYGYGDGGGGLLDTVLTYLFFTLNMVISMLCLYSLPSVLQCINTYSGNSLTVIGSVFEFDILNLEVVWQHVLRE